MFFPPLSFIFFALLCFFFLLWHGSLWCNWIESSVRDSQWETALAVIGGQTLFSASCDPCSWPRALIFAMLAAVLSQRVVLQGHKKKQGETLWSHTTNVSFIFPSLSWKGHGRSYSSSTPRTATLSTSHIHFKCYDWQVTPFDYLGIWTSSLSGCHHPGPINSHRSQICVRINSGLPWD